MVDFFIRLQIFYECLDNSTEGFFVGFISGERLEEERNSVLIRCYTKNKSFEIPSPILRMYVSNLDLFVIGVRFVFSVYTEICGVDMDAVRAKLCWKQALCYDFIE